MVRIGFCGRMRTRLDLWISARGVAVRIGRGHLDADRDQAVVVNEAGGSGVEGNRRYA